MCIQCNAQDGRGTVLSGPALSKVSSYPFTLNVASAGTRFIEITDPGQQLTISGSQGALLGGALIRLETN